METQNIGVTSLIEKSSKINLLWLELTQKCNLTCEHCYADSSPSAPLHQKMKLSDWKKVIIDAHNYGCRNIQFIGGEPTLYPHLQELLELSSSAGYSNIEVYTNGLFLTEKIKSTILKCNIDLAFSFYSAKASEHDFITKSSGSFQKTVENIKWAIKNNIGLRIGIVKIHSINNDIHKAKMYLEELGVKNIRIDNTRKVGRGHNNEENGNPYAELCGNCSKGRLCVTPTGEVYPCVFSRFYSLGDVTQGISTIINSDTLDTFKKQQRDYEKPIREKAAILNSQGYLTGCDPDDCGPTDCTPNESCSPDDLCSPDTPCMPHR